MDHRTEEEREQQNLGEEAVHDEKRRKQKITIRLVYADGSSRWNSSSSCTALSYCCQADECLADLQAAKRYNRRHKVCERHAKAPVVLVSGTRQRFCQQCSKFHELALFDDNKRSCRERLASHNERRRKAQAHHADLQSQPESDIN
ncbi:hypothetical protein AAHE18_05G031500 [Arachis hypogaea]|uniref:SBP-type domain-containing protein n=1 Tax=Arachis hypogaea TaxID=3818 RepID=A0A444WUS8_ARAHY|nr:squamosa promoter-binding-like protein 3 isoform X1 [Arachis hypogaea]XP_025703293.1 squamosa promoter-binding-like protein 3 isoform X1 [Arachis hypogaea]QHO40308.1 Squamosa promoter-binding-like protein [Arachis hypogaea]RYQ81198.1 hypothetical protein Ahy_Scaffold1g107187 [Arachis hypogaea]